MTDVAINGRPLGGSALSQDLQHGGASTRWLATAPRTTAEWRARMQARMRETTPWGDRLEALMPAFMPTGHAADRLDRIRTEGGVMVTTGQQPALFGGPIYTWSKAMSALALANALERATGTPTVAVFWAATDDADFAEAAATYVSRRGEVEELRSVNVPAPGTPMSLSPLGDLRVQLDSLRAASGSGADARALAAVTAAYGEPSRTMGEAFLMLLRELLAPLGMAVLDASHSAVETASATTLDAARRQAGEIERALIDRTRAIRAAGYEPQVEHVAGLSLVFHREGATRRRLLVAETSSIRGGHFTPNVLLRPIVEQAILPTVAYVAGPGELAYFAQSSGAAEVLGVPAPLALPRWSCELIEPAVQLLLDSLAVTPDDVAEPNALEGRVAHASLSTRSRGAIESLRESIVELPTELADEAQSPELAGAVQGAVQLLQHRVDRLERRLVAALKRRGSDRLRDVASLRAALYPRGVRQERLLNLTPILTRNGLELLTEMCAAARVYADELVRGLDNVHPR